ncbi:MAG: AtpZ/AtpI family protein [Planctomycetota bacterium]
MDDRRKDDEPPEGKGNSGETPPGRDARLLREIEMRSARKKREAEYRDRGFWTGVGVMGLVGWSVILPAVLGAYLGLWIDRELGLSRIFSGGLALLGLCAGCWNAWRMVRKVLKPRRDVEGESVKEVDDGHRMEWNEPDRNARS